MCSSRLNEATFRSFLFGGEGKGMTKYKWERDWLLVELSTLPLSPLLFHSILLSSFLLSSSFTFHIHLTQTINT